MAQADIRYPLDELYTKLPKVTTEGDVTTWAAEYTKKLAGLLRQTPPTLATFCNFWPPRLVQAMKSRRLIGFFGAGLSLPSGLPSWSTLITREFPLDASFQTDQDLENDPLTRAELSAQRLGAEALQERLRASMKRDVPPTCNHMLVAALRLPAYITTNYDNLFEKAWSQLYDEELQVVVNSADLASVSAERPVLFKIHGCVQRQGEHLILTRSDYRRHYRYNAEYFDRILELLSENDTLFLGFSHRDPEVTRLVEEAIWKWDNGRPSSTAGPDAKAARKWNLYSLQFDMKAHTPEIFAARGIVALEPTRDGISEPDYRSAALARGLIDLCGVAETDVSEQESLDRELAEYARTLSGALDGALATLGRYAEALGAFARSSAATPPKTLDDGLAGLLTELAEVATQGVYLVNRDGVVQGTALPEGLKNPSRRTARLGTRPYFRQAKTYRTPFVSDSFESAFNGHATIAICHPLVRGSAFDGLLFAACQIGAWALPIEQAQAIWNKNLDVLLVDSNGVCLLPTQREMTAVPASSSRLKDETGLEPLNRGFPFQRLLNISRRDRLVTRIMENVVPLGQDDDVLTLSGDVRLYTVVTELRPSRWKLAVSKAVQLSRS